MIAWKINTKICHTFGYNYNSLSFKKNKNRNCYTCASSPNDHVKILKI